jgi:hypothetical protein
MLINVRQLGLILNVAQTSSSSATVCVAAPYSVGTVAP